MSQSFIEFIAEYGMQGYIPNKRVATMNTRAQMNMARDERRTAAAGDSPTKSIDIQIASMKEKLARLTKRRYDLLRAKGITPDTQKDQEEQQQQTQARNTPASAAAPTPPGVE